MIFRRFPFLLDCFVVTVEVVAGKVGKRSDNDGRAVVGTSEGDDVSSPWGNVVAVDNVVLSCDIEVNMVCNFSKHFLRIHSGSFPS